MQVRQIRNATLRIDYGGQRFLIDPYLAAKDTYPGFEGTMNSHIRNPLVELATPMSEILDVDAVIVTHSHPDHWDEAAVALVPKHLPLFARDEADAELFRSQGFADVRNLADEPGFKNVSLTRTAGQHGSDATMAAAGEVLGEVCGVLFTAEGEKTLYLAGDTVWNASVEEVLADARPDIIILNAGDAQIPGLDPIIMGKEDVKRAHDAAPFATVIASHLEAVNHAVLTRAELNAFVAEHDLADRVLVPADGEAYSF